MNHLIKSTVSKFSTILKSNSKQLNRLLNINSYKFSVVKSDKNPNQMPQQLKKLMQQQKNKYKTKQLPILKDISMMKSIQQLPEICKKMNFMSKENRQIALRYLLSGIYQKKLPYNAIQQKAVQVFISEFPHLKLQTEIFQINHYVNLIHQLKQQISKSQQQNNEVSDKQKKISESYNKINDLYLNAFSVSLKSISHQHLARSKATLYKHFAQYNSQELFNPKLVQKASQQFEHNIKILKKSRDFLIQSLKCHKDIILVQYKKLDSDQMKALKEQNSQRHEIKINAIKENIRKIVESMGQCLYSYFKIINKENRVIRDPFEHKNRKLELLSLIQSYIPLYSVIPGIKQLSVMYHKLFKIRIQAKFTTEQPKDQAHAQQKVKQAVQDYSRLFKQCQYALQQVIKLDNFHNIKQISTLMISIKYMIGRNLKKTQVQLKNNLAIIAKSIIDQMKEQYKKPMQYYMLEFIKEILQLKS